MKHRQTFLFISIALILGARCAAQTVETAPVNSPAGTEEKGERPSQAQIARVRQILNQVDEPQDPVEKKKQLEEAYQLVKNSAEDSLINAILFYLAFNANISGDWARGFEWAMAGMDRIGSDSTSYAYSAFANMIAQSFEKQRDYSAALSWAKKSIRSAEAKDNRRIFRRNRWASRMVAAKYMALLHHPLDSCLHYARESIRLGKLDSIPESRFAYSYMGMAHAFDINNRPDSAIAYFHRALAIFNSTNDAFTTQETERDLASLFMRSNRPDSALYYARKAYEAAPGVNNWDVRMDAAKILSSVLEKTDKGLSLAYLKEYLHLKDSLFNRDKYNEIALIRTNEQLKARDAAEKERRLRSRIITGSLLSGLVLMAFVGIILLRNNQARKKTNRQLAEKNHELEIESSLEKVRSRSLAMRRSNELEGVVASLFDRLKELKIAYHGAGIYLFDREKRNMVLWIASSVSEPAKVNLPFDAEIAGNIITCDLWSLREKGEDIRNKRYAGREKDDYYRYVDKYNKSSIPETVRQMMIKAESWTASFAAEEHCALLVDSWEGRDTSNSDFLIVKRVARVFEQAYMRFLDLQKAEMQAREAQIEAALERVRSRTMTMQKSEELLDVTIVMYDQLQILGIKNGICSIAIMDASTGEIEWWMEGAKDGYRFLQSYHVDNFNHKTHIEQFEHWKKGTVYATVKVSGKDKIEFDDFYFTKSGFKLVPEETKKMLMQLETLVFSMAFMQYGAVCWAPNPIDDTDAKILQRFAKVFEQTYTRFLDLQKAEHQAREAVKQASLDRVRGEIASMRSQQDLDRITPLIWTELHNLGIRFSRCGIFIMDIPNEEVNIFLSSPQGKAIAAFDLDFRKINLQQVVEHWNKHEILVTHWSQKEFAELAEILVHEGIIKDHSHYLDTLPNTGQYLHYIPFLQGMLYVAHTESLKQEELELVKSLADSFSVAYARYEDFSRMEAAKLRTEKALNELKQTQAQLIQSEKMASLGELTAGIAHEIQNPLNFVNNFSDLNKELIEELQAELKKGDIREATSISESLKENEEKINIHGRRADGIVKSMLQHSRASGGQKEPTDINKLVDEYVRLAYHGYRARQKDFNVTLDIRLDPEAGQVKMVAQDIGRVLLNLLNNAFQAVNEKSRSGGDGYQPTVTVSTMRSPRGIDIRVEDNGPGIPDEIKDKIFQPFFTTRPTGEGTGLGLSLSYDIMKAHGGTITLQQNEGQGSVFTLEIPANPLNTGK